MQRLRQPAVAGSFYPSDPSALRTMVQGFLGAVTPHGGPPKAIIAPHAGYIYSGPIAAQAYVRLALGRAYLRRIVLLGPSHRVAFKGLATCNAEGFTTPLGVVPVDQEGIQSLLGLPFVHAFDPAHALEHSLEAQLPFLQETLGPFSLVPVVVGDADPGQVAEVLARLWGGEETALVISSDLSHYHPYAAAQSLDQATSIAIAKLQPNALEAEDACGSLAIRGLLLTAQVKGLRAEILEVRNSGDTAGDKARVVGYGAYAFT